MSNTYVVKLKLEEAITLDGVESIVYQESSGTYDVLDKDGKLIGIYPVYSISHITRK